MMQTNPQKTLFYGLIVAPAIIFIAAILIVIFTIVLRHETQTPEALMRAVQTGPASERAQKAEQLAQQIGAGHGLRDSAAMMKAIMNVLKNETSYDAPTRAAMAKALGYFNEAQAKSTLRNLSRVKKT